MGRAAVEVEIRPLAEKEIGLLEQQLASGPPEKHQERLLMQQQGEAVYLVAWLDRLPVGHVLLRWAGSPHGAVASRLLDCPDIEDLWVSPEYRSRGIGSRLMDAAEALVRQRGYARVGLGVAVDNVRARSLYQRRGYRESGLGEFEHGTLYVDEQGRRRAGREIDTYLIKDLDRLTRTPALWYTLPPHPGG